ncbi:hypothetical protein [Micromonospora sp. NPDC002717]|uniref:hypothetical protein n=1 Tax=Micromonospora sp. NPDC002717 TaxID=3154424 RepID=UPI003317A7F5
MTTIAKKVGGPATLLIATLASGYIIGRTTEAGGKKAFKAWVAALKNRNTPCATKGQLFRVVTDGEDSSGLKLRAGDEYRVLECDADAILIEVLNDPDNPYFVSGEFLTTISDFPAEDTGEVQTGD